MAIFVTGDTHGRPDRLSSKYFPTQENLTGDDLMIILGDFGLVFDQEEGEMEKLFLDWLDQKPFTVLAALGNHENYDRIETLPVEERFGAPVRVLRPSVFLLESGYVYNLNGKKAFVFNGAASHDISDGLLDGNDPDWREKAIAMQEEGKKYFRVKGVSWWPQEVEKDEAVYERGIKNLEAIDYKPDFVFTHCASDRIEEKLGVSHPSKLTSYFETLEDRLSPETIWLFGHYHIDAVVAANRICLYEQIARID
ncbi:MAG: metallophosphatase family protein [Solobacterium sp.]|nr:metallophosphatase family protein [Solobacterium sp.]